MQSRQQLCALMILPALPLVAFVILLNTHLVLWFGSQTTHLLVSLEEALLFVDRKYSYYSKQYLSRIRSQTMLY